MAHVRDQALEIARGWSGPDAPASWRLTAAMFEHLAADPTLLAQAATIPALRLPALLFVASVQYAVAAHPDDPLAAYYPQPGRRERPVDEQLGARLSDFCSTRRDELAAIWRGHLYQMNEVARCTQITLALGVLSSLQPGRDLAIVDVGTGSGLGMYPDRYRYELSDGRQFGDPRSSVAIHCLIDGDLPPHLPVALRITTRTGIDANPIALDHDAACTWLAACVPPEAAAQFRLAAAIEVVRADDPRILRGDAIELLPTVLAEVPAGPLIAVVDAYTSVFFDDAGRQRCAEIVAGCGQRRDVAWISLDPLVPLGTEAQRSVQGLPVPARLVEQNRRGGVFALLSLVAHLDGQIEQRLLATAHPSGTRMEWLDESTADPP